MNIHHIQTPKTAPTPIVNLYHQLLARPRRRLRRWQRQLGVTLAIGALLLALSQTPSVHASTITVDGITCTLENAIQSANSNLSVGGCTAGDDAGGYDTIDLQTDVLLTAS